MTEAALYLIPVGLGNPDFSRVLPAYNKLVVDGIRHFIVEEVRTARRFLRQLNPSFDIDSCTFYPMGKHSNSSLYASYLRPLAEGMPIGVVSEAGCPAVADPGAGIVSIAQQKGYKVVPLVGPSSILMAVMGSGLSGQSFAFVGYLPIDPTERTRRIKLLESRAMQEGQTQLCIETPYRNHKLFDTLTAVLAPRTRLCIAAGITTDNEWIRTCTVAEWKRIALPDLSHTPSIFLFGK